MRPRLVVGILALSACATSRSAKRYRDDTHSLLESRSTALQACYEKALASAPQLEGSVTIHFVVEKRTGRFKDPTFATDPTPPQPLVFCVLGALDGLQLDPPDAKEGRATFVYQFVKPRNPAGLPN